MKSNEGSYLKRCFIVMQVIPLLCMAMYQTSLFGAVEPGVYKVTITAAPVNQNGHDTWTFSSDGKFVSEGLGIESEWENTGNNTFEIKTDKQEIKDAIIKNFYLIGLSDSDFSIKIKKLEISGTSDGNTIKGNISTSVDLKIKKPVKTTFTTSGSVSFEGEQ